MSKSTVAHYERFASEFHMLRFFGKYLPKLDVMASAKMVPGVYVYDGQVKATRNYWQFLEQMEALTDLGINIKASTLRMSNYIVFFDKELKDAAKFVENSAPVVTSSLLSTDVKEEEESGVKDIVENQTVDEDNVIKPVEEPVVDLNETPLTLGDVEPEVKNLNVEAVLAEASALNVGPKATAKQALEEFGIKYGASLTKSKTFENMLEELKAHLTA